MEKQNLPYRYLRNQKTKSSKFLRKSLLVPLRKKQEEFKSTSSKYEKSSIMSQNVSQYLHMMNDCHIKENYIKWAINLRTTQTLNPKSSKEVAIPDVYFKKTQSLELKQNKDDHERRKKFNTADYSQFLGKNQDFITLNESSLDYMTSLRGYSSNQKQFLSKEKFSSIPKKSKNSYPTFLKKQFVHKIKGVKEEEKESGLDGSHKYPKYTSNILRDKNYGLLCSFTKGKHKTSLPTLAWQIGLRSYQ